MRPKPFYRQALSHEPGSVDALQGVDVDFRETNRTTLCICYKLPSSKTPNSAQLYLLQGQALAQNNRRWPRKSPWNRLYNSDKQN